MSPFLTAASLLSLASPSSLAAMPNAQDYTLQYWHDGWRGRTADGRKLRVIQTGRYALALDTERMTIPHLGAIRTKLPYAKAASAPFPQLAALPPADLTLTIDVDGKTYRCTGAEAPTNHGGPRIVEAGRWLQRSDVTNLIFADADGKQLTVDARLETIAWPDHLGFVFEATPGQGGMQRGAGFGRVGGGWGFDGSNDLVEASSPDLDPETLSVEMWVYVPDLPDATAAYPWLFCKGGNEWVDGAYGLALIGGAPTARLCIGGGRDNAFDAEARHEGGGRIVLTREAWHHLAMTYDGKDLRIYVDGRPAGSTPVNRRRSPYPLHPTPSTPALSLARRLDNSGDGYRFRGAMDEVRLYSRVLTDAEVAEHFAHPEAVKPEPAIVRSWLFDPNGDALARRPSKPWGKAAMRMELRTGGTIHAASLELKGGETWASGTRRTVGLAIDPALGRQAPSTTATVTASDMAGKAALPVDRDDPRGWTKVNLDALTPVGDHNNAMDRARLVLSNPTDQPQPLRLLLEKNAESMRVPGVVQITGLTPILRDMDGNPTGIPVQVSKNWHAQPGRDLVYQGGWLHAAAFLRLPPRSKIELELTIAYAHWGGVAAASHAQLCLIGWGSNQEWNQSAVGAWGESICYEPDQAQAECLICDVRPVMVASVYNGTPVKWGWTGNVGGGDLVRWFDKQGKRVFPGRMNTVVKRVGPSLTEVTYTGSSGKGALKHSVTVSLMRSDDIVRGVYRLRMDAVDAVDFSRFVIFQIGADTYSYTGERRMAFGSAAGMTKEWPTQWGGNTYRTQPIALTGRTPWVSLHDCAPRNDGGDWMAMANRGIVVRGWKARLGGKPAAPWFAEHGVQVGGADTSTADIVPPPGVTRLLPGDFVEATFEHVIVPQRTDDYYGPNAALKATLAQDANTWRMIWREAKGNALEAKSAVGTIASSWPLIVQTSGNRAQLTITGGLGYVPVTFTGLTDHRSPLIETREPGGPWRKLDQSVHGKDFWQADYRVETGTWDVTFGVPMDGVAAREVRARVGGETGKP